MTAASERTRNARYRFQIRWRLKEALKNAKGVLVCSAGAFYPLSPWNGWSVCSAIPATDLRSPRRFRQRGRLPLLSTRSGEQRLFDDHQIGQGEQRIELCGVLL